VKANHTQNGDTPEEIQIDVSLFRSGCGQW
jgi:hypothetical protein